MKPVCYLAGPDVFLADAAGHAQRKVEICARHGLEGLPPLNEDIASLLALPHDEAWRAIFHKDVEMMERSGAVIANLTPFRGASADSGTLVEIGWFLGRGRPVFGFSNSATPFDERSRRQISAIPDPSPGIAVESFGLADNLMIPGAVLFSGDYPMVLPLDGKDRPFEALDVFERCVEIAAWKLGVHPAPSWLAA